MPTQQEKPSNNGFPPDLINFTILLFSPIAAIARIIKNLLKSLIGAKNVAETPQPVAIVVITEARIK